MYRVNLFLDKMKLKKKKNTKKNVSIKTWSKTKLKLKITEKKIKPDDLKNYTGCFLTGSAAEVTPVSQIGMYSFKVLDIIGKLSDEYQLLVRKK